MHTFIQQTLAGNLLSNPIGFLQGSPRATDKVVPESLKMEVLKSMSGLQLSLAFLHLMNVAVS